MALVRACLTCKAEVDGSEWCPHGHSTTPGWYIMRVEDGVVLGLGHRDLSGYLTPDGSDLTGYRLLGTLRRPEMVVNIKGVAFITPGVLKSFIAGGRRVRCVRVNDGSITTLPPSTPVRPLPNMDSPRLLRAAWRAAQEEAGAA